MVINFQIILRGQQFPRGTDSSVLNVSAVVGKRLGLVSLLGGRILSD